MRRLLLAACLIPATALAQTPPPDIVVTATRVPTLIEQIPAGVTVIDRATIDANGYTTLTQALSAMPGAHVVQSGGDGGNSSLFIRGTNSNHVLVLRDGVPLNDPSDPGGAFNFGVDSLADVERIEIVRGPMSSLYGSGAIGGVVNLITARGHGPASGTIEAAAGLPAQVRGAATLSGQTGRFDYHLAVEGTDESGFDTTPKRMSFHTGARNPFAGTVATLNLGADLTDTTRATLFLRGRSATFHLDEPGYDANFYRGFDRSVTGRAALSHTLLDGAWETTLSLARLQTDRRYKEPLEAADPNQAQSDTRYHGRRTELRWDNTLHIEDRGPASNTALVFGAGHTEDSSDSAFTGNFYGYPYSSNVHASATSDAGHFGAQTTLLRRLTLTADIRGEDARYGGSAVTWRAGGVLAVPEILSRLKASYGTAFRAPSLFDLFGVDSYGYMGNPNLRPERSVGYEVGVAFDLPRQDGGTLATLDLTWFNNRIRDLIQIVYAPGYISSTPENVASARTEGLEASLTLHPTSWFDTILTYTRTETRDLATGAALLRRPREQVSLAVQARPIAGLVIAPELIYSGAFQDFLYDDNGLPLGTGWAHPGAIVNLSASYALSPRLTLFATGRNIGNSHFEPANGYQTPGASLLAGVRARF
jgi:vitamin B12 transporter